MIIKIVGANTINGIKLRQRIIDVVSKIDQKITINLLDDTENEGFLPILYINNHLISKGKVLSNKEIIKSIKKIYDIIYKVIKYGISNYTFMCSS